jgi:hypothetical protein
MFPVHFFASLAVALVMRYHLATACNQKKEAYYEVVELGS